MPGAENYDEAPRLQQADARILGQILAAQNISLVLPDSARIAGFFAQALLSVPGVSSCRVCLLDASAQAGEMDNSVCEECTAAQRTAAGLDAVPETGQQFKCKFSGRNDIRIIEIRSSRRHFGFLVFKIADPGIFSIYRPFLGNLAGHIGISLENRVQNTLLQNAHNELERRVKERTRDLNEANKCLIADIAAREQAEMKLSESEKKYRHLIETLNEGIWMIDKEARTTYVNPRMAEMLGYTIEEMQGKALLDFMDEQGRQISDRNIERRKRGIREQHDFEFIKKDGTRIYTVLETSPVTDDAGNYAGALAAVVDMTERRKLQKELSEQSRILETFFAETIMPLAILDRDFNFIRVNEAYAKAGQRKVSDFPGHNHFEFYPSDAKAIFEAAVRTKKTYQANARPFKYPDHPEWGVSYWDWVLFPLLDARGEVEFLAFSLQDVTKRKHAEDTLKELNKELEQRVIARTGDLEKKSAALEANSEELLKIVDTLKTRTEELRKANLALREVDRLKSMFIASMSHELRTPLNSVIGFSSVLLKEWCGPVNDEQKEDLSSILAAGKHLLMLINDVIDVSKIEAGRLESIVEDFDLSDLVSEALGMIKSERNSNAADFIVRAPRQDMHTDRRRLLQCVINLISNAVKFTIKGNIMIKAQAFESSVSAATPDFVEISVTDTGVGIREEDMSKLFNPFVRLVSPLTARTKGTGLGLHLVKKITNEILKGEVFAKSIYGQGSTFGLRIPIKLEREE